ncbi:MAG TPA: lipopolysaccharide assembly protein LapA domain-containing protein [Dictyobacter sp.]|nr:lipopolysaccharide assembly protein LapA domain-containing protein [Dictyobacter sp.]
MTVLNLSTQVHLTILSWQTPDLPVGFWMLATLFLGALLLYLISVSSALKDRREMKKLHQRIAELERNQQKPVNMTTTTTAPMPVAPQQGQPQPVQGAYYSSGSATGPIMPMPGMSSQPQPPQGELPTQNFRQ